jgi:Bifunctional DNA primase/polymerase, N-terminal
MNKKSKLRMKTGEDHDQRQRPQGNNNKSAGKNGTRHATALLYAKAGLPVVPLHGKLGGGCTCRNEHCKLPGNHPRTANGLQDATTNLKKIKRFWRKWPNAKIGVPLGRDVIAVVIKGKAGRKALKKLEERQ